MRRRESGILSLPKWMTDEVPDGDANGSAGDAAEVLPEVFEKLLFQNREPANIMVTTPAESFKRCVQRVFVPFVCSGIRIKNKK